MQAYKNLLNELGDQAGQHELIAENLSSSVVQELSTLTKQLKDDRRKVNMPNFYTWMKLKAWTQPTILLGTASSPIETSFFTR